MDIEKIRELESELKEEILTLVSKYKLKTGIREIEIDLYQDKLELTDEAVYKDVIEINSKI